MVRGQLSVVTGHLALTAGTRLHSFPLYPPPILFKQVPYFHEVAEIMCRQSILVIGLSFRVLSGKDLRRQVWVVGSLSMTCITRKLLGKGLFRFEWDRQLLQSFPIE